MRPRELPAEDTKATSSAARSASASMRPRELPAEDAIPPVLAERAPRGASMRPRELPAEDAIVTGGEAHILGSFNEAAGVTRGRQRASLTVKACNSSGLQ